MRKFKCYEYILEGTERTNDVRKTAAGFFEVHIFVRIAQVNNFWLQGQVTLELNRLL